MSRFGAGVRRAPEPEEPVAPLPTVEAYVIERDGPGWRASILELPAHIAAKYVRTTYEPDLFGLSKDKLDRAIEERAVKGGR